MTEPTRDELRTACETILRETADESGLADELAAGELLARHVLATLDGGSVNVNSSLLEACIDELGYYTVNKHARKMLSYSPAARVITKLQAAIKDAEAEKAERALPVDELWLRSIGSEPIENVGRHAWIISVPFWFVAVHVDGSLILRSHQSTLTLVNRIATRGAVLDLLAALGIQAKGKVPRE